MFLNNRYTQIYYRIVNNALNRKVILDNTQRHHIIPKCLGGTNNSDNLVTLTYKEHRVCHCLLIKMQTTTGAEIKMRHAYGFFNKNSKFNGPRYKRGNDNIFSTPALIEQVRIRMTTNNPMSNPEIKAKVMKTRQEKKLAGITRTPRVLKDKFITPLGIFKSKKDIQKFCQIPEWTLNTIYNNLDGYPLANNRASKKISHLNISPSLTWRDNGFSIIT